MKFQFSFLLTLLCLHFSIFAQKSTLEGKILSADSLQTIPGASVFLENTSIGTASDAKGNYRINNVPSGNYTLVISSIGFAKQKFQVKILGNETKRLNVSMKEDISQLSEVTILGTRNSLNQEIPGSMNFISPKELQQFSYTDINRTLRAVPGINMQEEDGFGLRPNIGLRGTGVERSSKITVMEDGILMAPAPYAAPAAYYFPSIGRMQGVEILKGSSQIKYGPYTTGGAINLISTQIPNNFGGRINLMGGSFGGRSLHAYVGNSHQNVAYLVESFQYSSDGFKQLDGGGTTGFDKKDNLAKVRINTNEKAKIYQSLTFKIGKATETSNQTYLGLTQDDFEKSPYRLYVGAQLDEMNTEQSQFSLSHLIKFSKSLSIQTTAYRSEFKRNWYKLASIKDSTGNKTSIGNLLDKPSSHQRAYDIVTGKSTMANEALYLTANNRSYYSKGIQSILKFEIKRNQIEQQFELGYRIHQDQVDRFQWNDEYAMSNGILQLKSSGIHGTESNRVETANAIASYFTYHFKYKKITLSPGIRQENISQNRLDYGKSDPSRTESELATRSNTTRVLIPGIGLLYRFTPNVNAFAGIHKGFAPAGSKEFVKPEQSINYELGTRFSAQGLSGQAVGFYTDYSNLLGTDLSAAGGSGLNEQFNGGKVRSYGLEFNLTYDLFSKLSELQYSLPFTIVYTYTQANFLNDFNSEFEGWGTVSAGDQFPYLANNQLALILSLEHKLYSLSLSGRYSDKMRTLPGKGVIPENEQTDAYFVLDASANITLQKNLKLFGSATNLSNEVYVVSRRPAGLRPGMPIAFNLGLKANF